MRPDRRRSGRGSTALRRIADRRWWIAYAIVVALGMYSQYMMAFVWMTHVLWLYVALRRHGHARRFPRMLIPYALAVALYIPWIPSAVGQFASSTLPPLKETMNLSELTSVFSILTTGFDAKRLTSGMTVALLAMLAVLIAGSSRLRDTAGPVCAVRSIVWSVGLCGAFGCTNGDAADRFVWRGRSCGRRHDLLVCAARTTARTIAPPAGLRKRKRDCPRAPAADALQCYRCQRYNGCRHRRKGHNDRE